MRTIQFLPGIAGMLGVSLAALAFAGCGGSSSNNGNNGGGDGGVTTTPGGGDAGSPTSDSGFPTGTPPGTDASLPDGSVPPSGTQLAKSGTLVLNGVTTDDFAIYTDTSAKTVYAVALTAGSAPISLGSVDSYDDVTVSGKVVLIGTNSSQAGVGPLSVWKSGAAKPASLATAAAMGSYATSGDDAYVLYFDGVDANATTGNLYAAATDGTGAMQLVAGVDLQGNVCAPSIQFGGTTAVAAYCLASAGAGADAGSGDDGGTAVENVATVATYAAPGWKATSLSTTAQPIFTVDPKGTTVLVTTAAGLLAYPAAGGSPVTIDATGTAGGLLTNDGSHAIYTTSASALVRAATTSPPGPTTLSAAGSFASVYGLSPDENWTAGSSPANGGNDLFLASATTAGTATSLSTAAAIGGDLFTADSSHVLYFTNVSKGSGTLTASPTAGGSPVTLGTGAIYDLATKAGKVVFSDNFNRQGGTQGTADLRSFDTAAGGSSTLLVSLADPYVFLSTEKDKIVYTWSDYPNSASAGLWVIPAP
ncbi:MAG TPA: hypothetical protein VGI39_00720 [Polyangiaceae bacterium]|jgi:hypothetical protein